MTRAQAMKQAMKRWGKDAAIQANDRSGISSPEKREAALVQLRAVRAEIQAIDDEIEARLKALDWLQELRAKRRELRKQQDAHAWGVHYHRFQVGSANSMFFHVHGSGDTWEEAFAEADRKDGKP